MFNNNNFMFNILFCNYLKRKL